MQAIQKALDLAESKKASPVNQEEAAEGRIDYAKVVEILLHQKLSCLAIISLGTARHAALI